MAYLLDTNVISELRKGERADRRLSSWYAAVDDDDIFLSVLTLGEIRRGIESLRRRDAASAAALDTWFGRLADLYGERVIPLDRAIAEEWGRMGLPDPLPAVDGLLAATARVRGLTLATRNAADIARTGVDLVNPFAD